MQSKNKSKIHRAAAAVGLAAIAATTLSACGSGGGATSYYTGADASQRLTINGDHVTFAVFTCVADTPTGARWKTEASGLIHGKTVAWTSNNGTTFTSGQDSLVVSGHQAAITDNGNTTTFSSAAKVPSHSKMEHDAYCAG